MVVVNQTTQMWAIKPKQGAERHKNTLLYLKLMISATENAEKEEEKSICLAPNFG